MNQIVVSKPNRALAIPAGPQMENLFPEARALPGTNFSVIKHGLAEYVLLRRLGYAVPNPMSCYYEWPAPLGQKVFDVQRITCSLLTANPRAYVLNAMGTGKTRSALWAWDYLYGNNYAKKLLVVAKLSTLNFTWRREIFATLPHRKCVVLHGSKAKRLELLSDITADIYIINHDGIKVISDQLAKRADIDVLVLDELATYRGNNDRSKFMVKFAQRFAWVWGMTGSPMPNEPTDVWMQCKILTPHTVPKYFTHARDRLMKKVAEHMYAPKDDAIEVAYSWMQPAVRFSLDDVVELPDVVEQFVDVPMGVQQQHVYKTLSTEFIANFKGKQITAVNAGAALSKLLQISSGWVYTDKLGAVHLDNDDRLRVLRDLIMSATGKVLVFSAFKHTAYGISKFLGVDGEDYIEHAVITGDVNPKERDRIFNLFQNTNKYKVINAHPGCMSHGITLTAADTIIWFGPITSYETYEQANARIRRVGQKHRQQVIHLQATPAERRIYKLLRAKQTVQDRFLELFEDATTAAMEQA